VSDDKSPLEQAIDQAMDAFVYAPIGLIFDGPDLFPKLAERGRNQVQTARMMGEMVVKMGQSEAEKRAARTQGPLRDALTAVGVVPPRPVQPANATTDPATATGATAAPPRPQTPAPKSTSPTKAAAKKTPPAKTTAKKAATKAPAAKKAATPSSASLGIPDYDSLSASQVVKRLQGMPGSELDAVRAYEAATRARKTILNRITQLQKG
jgi:hypothetical protein